MSKVDDAFMNIIEKYANTAGETEFGIHIADNESGKHVKLGNKKIVMVPELLNEITNIEGLDFKVESN